MKLFFLGVYVTGLIGYLLFQLFFWVLGGGKPEQFVNVIIKPFLWPYYFGKIIVVTFLLKLVLNWIK